MIDVAIVDDESCARNALSQKITRYFRLKQLSLCLDAYPGGRELLSCGKAYDLIFLDIQMENQSGMETARLLRQSGFAACIVFVTALPEYICDAFEVEASDYLIKPVEKARLERLLDRVCQKILRSDNRSLALTSHQNICRSIYYRDIAYCEAVNHTIEIHAGGTVHSRRMKIDELEKQLDGRFFRCHRSYLINLDHVCGYENGLALLADGTRIPVSRLRKQEFSQAVLRSMKEGKKT